MSWHGYEWHGYETPKQKADRKVMAVILTAIIMSILAAIMLGGIDDRTVPEVPLAEAVEGGEFSAHEATEKAPTPAWSVHFSPSGGCTDALVAEIGRAKKSIHVLAFSFTSEPIADALIAAHRRGVEVQVVVDKSQKSATKELAEEVAKAGVATWVDSKHAIAHNKVIILDGKTVSTGSFNFTASAELHNAENLLIAHDPAMAKVYEENFQKHRGHSDLWRRPSK